MDKMVKIWIINKATEMVVAKIYKNEIINKAKTGAEKFDVIAKDFWEKLESYILKEKEIDIVFINERIQKVRDMKESKKDFSNAILHLWGYFKKQATEMEKQGLFNILEEYMGGRNNQKSVIKYINTLLKKYPNKYLQESTLLTGENDETMA